MAGLAISAQRRLDLRDHLEQVADQADVGDLEDRRIGGSMMTSSTLSDCP